MESKPRYSFHRHLNTPDPKQKEKQTSKKKKVKVAQNSFQHLSLDGSLYSLFIT